MNKGLELTEKIPLKALHPPKKYSNKQPWAYVTAFNKNKLELFIEITKNLDQFKNDRIKNILDNKNH